MSMTRKEAQFGHPNDGTVGSNPPLLPPVISDEEAEMPVPLEQLRPAVAVHYPGDGPVSLIHYRSEPNYPNSFEHMPNSDIADFDSKVAYEDIGDIHLKRNGKKFQEQNATPPKSSSCPLVVLFLLVAVTFLMSAGAIGIAVYAFTSQGDSPTVSELQQQVAELAAKVETLETELLMGRIEQLETDLARISDTLTGIVNPPDGGNSTGTNVTISRDLLLYENCNTTLLEICQVGSSLLGDDIPSFQRCSTASYSLYEEDEYTSDIKCAILDSRGEENPATTALNIDRERNQFSCTCYVNVNNIELPRDSVPVDCGLFVTRCPKVYTFEL